MWAVKGIAILATGDQPPFAFEVAPPLFALGLVGLHARLGSRGDRAAKAGVALACAAAAFFVAGMGARSLELDVAFVVTTLATSLCILAALVLLGVAARRGRAIAGPARHVPLAMGVLAVPALLVGGLLAELDERLLEIPLVLLAGAWIALARVIWPPRRPRPA